MWIHLILYSKMISSFILDFYFYPFRSGTWTGSFLFLLTLLKALRFYFQFLILIYAFLSARLHYNYSFMDIYRYLWFCYRCVERDFIYKILIVWVRVCNLGNTFLWSTDNFYNLYNSYFYFIISCTKQCNMDGYI